MNTIQLQLDNKLYDAIGDYAASNATTVQQLLINYIYTLVEEKTEMEIPPIVSRLCGCVENTLDEDDIDGRKAFYEYMIEKHK